MKISRCAVAGLAVVATTAGVAVQAEEAAGSRATPVELYACTFREGKGMEDMQKQNAKWKKWADKAMPSYSAWMIVPNFRSSDEPFDVGWIGSWPSGADMGSGLDAWRSDSEDLPAGYDEIVECGHSLMTGVEVDAPDGPPSGEGMVWFSSCTIDEKSNPDEAFAAHKQLSAAYRGMGSKAQSWLFYPALGAGDIKFDYYSVVSWKNYAELGAGWEMYANGGGWKKRMQMMKDKVSCDSPRLYNTTMVKDGGPRT